MADEDGDKTEAPTPKRRAEAREQGNIARSPDLTAAVLILCSLFSLQWFGPGVINALKTLVQKGLGDSLSDLSVTSMLESIVAALKLAAIAVSPILLGAVLVAIVINVVQVGFNLTTKRLQPNLGVLNPLNGFGRIFGKGQGWVHLLMSLLKLVLVGAVAYSAIHNRIGDIVTCQQLTHMQIYALGAEVIYQIILRIGILLLVLAIIDYVYQKWKLEQSLKMTKQQVKEEMRSMEGDPKVKQRRRQLAIQLVQKRLQKDVPTADVVVTNPTEYAVAIKYDPDTMNAPKVVAKGQGFIAQKIRELAIENGIPILERKPLARALYKLVEVGHEIPEQFYSAVAEILAYVYELSGKLKRKVAV
jgi:flagellar biosynthetic protein FlhB